MTRFGKHFLFWFLLGIFIIGFGAIFAGKLAVDSVDAQFRASEQLTAKIASQYLREELAKPANDLRSVALLEEATREAISGGSSGGNIERHPAIENAFQTLLLRNPTYLQARWLSEDGVELARVERVDQDSVTALAKDKLQDKSQRGYVDAALQLGRNELYVSPLDLNMEEGKIQEPHVPVIRMAMRVFADGNDPAGFFILNIGAQSLLDHLAGFSPTNRPMVLNADGYWLKGEKPEDEWGFMFGRETGLTFQHPDAWRIISSQPSGQQETGAALWTWETVEVVTSSMRVAQNVSLKLLTKVAVEELNAARTARLLPIVLAAGFIALLFGAGLYRLLREVKNRRKAEQAALAASDAKSSFLATMSHEIRTPMTGVIGLSDMLIDSNLTEENLFKVKRIKETGKALLRIINDILDLSKLDAGKFVIEKVNFHPLNIADDVVRLFYMTCPPEKKSKLHITANVSDNFPDVVRADPTRLRQVLVNLVGNAVKFTDAGTVSLVCDHDPDRKRLIFKVVDTGIGMNKAATDSLFQDFVQADASISRKYHGTGLGLAVCKRLVECMGGDISVTSELGKGSCFEFSIPYETVEAGDEVTTETVTADMHLPDVRALSILVAEDNEINQMIIKGLMKKLGHECVIASDGQKAFEQVRDGDFDLVLMDIRMPFVSGPEATRMIRELPGYRGQIPIIALTADLIAENKASYLEAGMNDCVGKPIDQGELKDAITQAVCAVVR